MVVRHDKYQFSQTRWIHDCILINSTKLCTCTLFVILEDQNNCSAPMNGMMKLSFLKFYDVTCDKGFKLNNFDNDHRYECVNGKLLNIYNKEAKCTESKYNYTSILFLHLL